MSAPQCIKTPEEIQTKKERRKKKKEKEEETH